MARLTSRMFQAIEAVGGEDLVFGLIADGYTVTKVHEELVAAYPEELEELSRGILSTWCNNAKRKERYLEARRTGAVTFAEDSVHIADDCIPEKGAIAKAKLQTDTRRWIAGKLDHDAWGDRDKNASVQVNVNTMHLDALKELAAQGRGGGDGPPAIEGDFSEVAADDWLEAGSDWLEDTGEGWLA